jgi:hypothetical protein
MIRYLIISVLLRCRVKPGMTDTGFFIKCMFVWHDKSSCLREQVSRMGTCSSLNVMRLLLRYRIVALLRPV